MFSTFKAIPILAAVLLLNAPDHAVGEGAIKHGMLKVGSTGINCYMPPCPWRGIVSGDVPSGGFQRPLWWGEILPTLDASDNDARRIRRAWDDFDCLLVEGAFVGSMLTVGRIMGACS
ncbi:hypothetical protein [Devosia sp. A449]